MVLFCLPFNLIVSVRFGSIADVYERQLLARSATVTDQAVAVV